MMIALKSLNKTHT